MSEEREIPTACLGCFYDMAEAASRASRLEPIVEVIAGAASGRYWLDLCVTQVA